ncbi:hypothetical protein [Hymenobacter sp.]|uniref:hypothetical protein n=1 Tax=Hymenobacter sp. TaxID=1898978 RepID=UPI00286ABF92|nr:hypothetical protein [Hymenobacter sp.]
MNRKRLEAAGFVFVDYLPSGTHYDEGNLYVLLQGGKIVRVYWPNTSDAVEVATGDLFAPEIHYNGSVSNIEELLVLVRKALL